TMRSNWLSIALTLGSLALVGCCCIPTGKVERGENKVERCENCFGSLRVSGPNVWLNDQRARTGQLAQFGDVLRTGPASAAAVDMYYGGELVVDQNTQITMRSGGPRFPGADQRRGAREVGPRAGIGTRADGFPDGELLLASSGLELPGVRLASEG